MHSSHALHWVKLDMKIYFTKNLISRGYRLVKKYILVYWIINFLAYNLSKHFDYLFKLYAHLYMYMVIVYVIIFNGISVTLNINTQRWVLFLFRKLTFVLFVPLIIYRPHIILYLHPACCGIYSEILFLMCAMRFFF